MKTDNHRLTGLLATLCACVLVVAMAACGGGDTAEQLAALAGAPAQAATVDDGATDAADAADAADDAQWDALAKAAADDDKLRLTPLTLRVDRAPVPVKGSDGRYHVVYEIELANFSGGVVSVSRLELVDARSAIVVAALDAAEIGKRLVVRDRAALPGILRPAQQGLLYLHFAFDTRAAIPPVVAHRLAVTVDSRSDSFTAARLRIARPSALVLDAPLRGPRYIAGDGCCDSTRHVQATLPLNGRPYTAQRFAIDWEQLDEQGRIYVGDPNNPASYVIYGQPAYAVADARVVAAVDGLPDTPPGSFPENITIEQADGNHVVLDLGHGRYALYAHFKPGSVRVAVGERVRRGQVLGLVGTSGNSSEPHLHFHVMDGPSPLASNGLPHRLRQFTSTRRGVSTAAFDQAIVDGQPIATEPVAGAALRERVMPLDLWIVDFAAP